jgi:hypothetical protein
METVRLWAQWSPCEELKSRGKPWSEKLQGPGEQGFDRRLDTVARQLARARGKVWIEFGRSWLRSLRVQRLKLPLQVAMRYDMA